MENSAKKKPNIFLRFLGAVWTGADGVRKVLHLILLLLIFLMFFGALSDAPRVLPDRAALYIEPYGALVEELEGDPYERALAELIGDGRPQTLIADVVDALDYAIDDDRIEVVYLELSSVMGTGLSKLRRVADAIARVRASGKSVVAYADFLGQQGYFLAAHADEVYLHPDGAILLRGYGRFRTYYKDVIDKLLLDWNVFRVGTHKSFVEPFTRMDMSQEDRESTTRWIEQLWALYQADVIRARELDANAIDDFATGMLDYVRDAGGDIAIAARDFGLVDELLTRNEIRERMIERVGESSERADMFSAIGMKEYLRNMRLLYGTGVGADNVGVIVAAGDIYFGEREPGTIGADSTAELLRRARIDETVAAVVLRIDSPGGSAFAAEVIADEIDALRRAGKPVVASMSSVAASGGYTIAMGADWIFASPATITGSIGVFGMFPTYQRTMQAIGMNTDGVGTTPWSGQFRPDQALSDDSRALLQLAIEDTYDDFISDVAERRSLDKDVVDRIGQGRVWTGSDAVENGLIDELGTLEDAIVTAAQYAGLDQGDYGVKKIDIELTAGEQLIVDLLSMLLISGIDAPDWLGRATAIESLAHEIRDRAAALLDFNDPKGIYSHCLCDGVL